MLKRFHILVALLPLGILLLSSCERNTLKNDDLALAVGKAGVMEVRDSRAGFGLHFDSTRFLLTINGRDYRSDSMAMKDEERQGATLTRTYEAGRYTFRQVDELQAGWRFLSRQVFVTSQDSAAFKVNRIVLFAGRLQDSVREVFQLTDGRYGVSLRLANPADDRTGNGCFLLIQNPYTQYEVKGHDIRMWYDSEMSWNPADGPFPTDRMCIGTYRMTGNTFRQDMAPEWIYEQDPAAYLAGGKRIDYAEIRAVTDCARAFLIGEPQPDVRVHIGWCENDYQIDRATTAGREEYRRIIDQAAAVGCKYVLYTPDNSALASLKENADAWGWESVLFLNLGQKIRKGEWLPKRDPVPESIEEILDYAKSKDIKLMAYAYPSLPWMQDTTWTAWRTKIGAKPEGYLTVDTGLRSFQDWWIGLLVDFYDYTGIGGYSFDHWWIAYTDSAGLVSSRYQQWFGTRRILEELRRRRPEMIIDGRQQYHQFGTWTWLAGTYPHPIMGDEQPGSFNSFPDLSTDRVTAARQRWVSWRLMIRDFTPEAIRPGFIFHQTQREDADRVMRRDRWRVRDWDYLGWKFNLLSAIATAPVNRVVNYLPAREIQEFKDFSRTDKQFIRKWLDFADENAKYLENIMPIIGQPMIGRCDGTSAILDDNGYLFLFNPNYRKLDAAFDLDESIGIQGDGKYLFTEVYPDKGLHPGRPGMGYYAKGDHVIVPMDGITVRVLRVEPVKEESTEPVLFNCTGKAESDGETVTVEHANGLVGARVPLMVFLPAEEQIKRLVVNGQENPFRLSGRILSAEVRFSGTDFRKAFACLDYDPAFNGSTVECSLTVPERIFVQLANRRQAWPVEYTADDRLAPWLDPSRLLLYVQIADPFRTIVEGGRSHRMPIRAKELTLEIDGKKVPLMEAYNGVYPFVERTNLGFFADISGWQARTPHKIRLTLPNDLKPGQFQGIFVDHVEDEYTDVIGQ